MTEPTPISVRIAKAKGCAPVATTIKDPSSEMTWWRCNCAAEGHSYPPEFTMLFIRDKEAWLTPAASFALFSEMVDAGHLGYVVLGVADDGVTPCYRWGLINLSEDTEDHYATGQAPTLPEAIALAWLAWKRIANAAGQADGEMA